MQYIISHTHWDREWFAPDAITKKMLPDFFEKLYTIIDNNPEYKFVLDGQMLLIEDYLSNFKEEERTKKEDKLKKYAKNITLGPYYGQIDWRIAEESAIRNILIGTQKAKKYGKVMKVGWLLDNFGFSSQVPQINNKAEIYGTFLWRGLKIKYPQIGFLWYGPDKSLLKGVFLLDSYRNLMRLTDYPEVKDKRLDLEIKKLNKYTKSNFIPLLNGYDLDPVPEDPTSEKIKTIFPDEFLNNYFEEEDPRLLKKVNGELMNGNTVSVFPGSLSTRQYLKIMHWKSEYLLSKILEPLSTIIRNFEENKSIENAWEYLVMNLVHDSIGGVGVDQIHDDMEIRYSEIRSIFNKNLSNYLQKTSTFLPSGYTSINLNPEETPVLFEKKPEKKLYRFNAPSGSISKVKVRISPVEYIEKSIDVFSWTNKFFKASVENGVLIINNQNFKHLVKPVLVEDQGDEYSSSFGKELNLFFSGMKLISQSDNYSKIAIDFTSNQIDLSLHLTFSELPFVNIEIYTLGKGTEYALLLKLTGEGEIISGSPFDSIKRPFKMIYQEPENEMEKFLVAAREVNFNDVFPMKDYVGLETEGFLSSFIAKGVYSYTTHSDHNNENSISLILVRSISWLSREKVSGRIGDAGPVMYTPGSEVKRKMKIETAFYISQKDEFLRYKNSFTNPPLLFYKNSNTEQTESKDSEIFKLYSAKNIEFVCMKPSIDKENIVLRFFNPTNKNKNINLFQKAKKTNLLEEEIEEFKGTINPKEILTLKIPKFKLNALSSENSEISILYPDFSWDISEDLGKPDLNIIYEMEKEAEDLRNKIKFIEEKIEQTRDIEKYKLMFEKYKMLRKTLELKLSALLNRSKIENIDFSLIESVTFELNDVRIKRRGIEFLLATLF